MYSYAKRLVLLTPSQRYGRKYYELTLLIYRIATNICNHLKNAGCESIRLQENSSAPSARQI
jgi:hypothetical protein